MPDPVIGYRSALPARPARRREMALVIFGSVTVTLGLILLAPILLVSVMLAARSGGDASAGTRLLLCCGVPALLGLTCIFFGVRGGLR